MRYYQIINLLGLDILFAEFLDSNCSLGAPYHDLEHACQMIEDTHEGGLEEGCREEELRVLGAASLYHDWGHSAGQLPDSANVRLAIDHVEVVSRTKFWPGGLSLLAVYQAIQATEFPYAYPAAGIELFRTQKIIRDADLLAAYRDTALPHVLHGLSREMRTPLRALVWNNEKFLESMPMNTGWGRRRKDTGLQVFKQETAALRAMYEAKAKLEEP